MMIATILHGLALNEEQKKMSLAEWALGVPRQYSFGCQLLGQAARETFALCDLAGSFLGHLITHCGKQDVGLSEPMV